MSNTSLISGIPDSVRIRIWEFRYIDLAVLIHRQDTSFGVGFETGEVGPEMVFRHKQSRAVQTLEEWDKAFARFHAIMIKRHPQLSEALIAHHQQVKKVAANRGDWMAYDEAFRRGVADGSIKWGQMNAGLLMDAMLFSKPGPAPNRGQAPQKNKGPKTSQHYVPAGFCFALHKGGDCTRSGCTWNHSCPQCNRGHSLRNCRNRDGPPPRESTQSENFPHNKRQGNEGRKWPVDREPGEPTAHEPTIVLVPRLPTPVDFKAIKPYLQGYPQEEVSFLEEGFTLGFRLGVQATVPGSNTAVRNPKMEPSLEDIMSFKIRKEVELGRVAGPFDTPPFPEFHCSPVRLEPKKSPGEYRFIHNLSHPYQSPDSVNMKIPQEAKSVHYASLDDAIHIIQELGSDVFLAKTDIKSAFKIIPIHPEDYKLLGFQWQGRYYYARTLPMGAGSSCAIFERFSTALQFIAETQLKVHRCLHVLDDFLFIAQGEDRCARDLNTFLTFCKSTGVPIAEDKTHGATQVLEFVGITLHIPLQCSILPDDKVRMCLELLNAVSQKEKVTLKQLQKLAGHLVFACRAVVAGRPFITAIYSLMKKVKKPEHKVRITRLAKEDIRIWSSFLTSFNGRSFFQQSCADFDPDVHLYTDASTSAGFGGCFQKEWIYGGWSGPWLGKDILVLEAYAVVVAVATWGQSLRDRSILLHVDNQALVHIINTGHSSSELVTPLIRILYLLCLRHNISFCAEHIPGHKNSAADALSRFQWETFREFSPDAAFLPRRIPQWVHTNTFNPWQDPITSYL